MGPIDGHSGSYTRPRGKWWFALAAMIALVLVGSLVAIDALRSSAQEDFDALCRFATEARVSQPGSNQLVFTFARFEEFGPGNAARVAVADLLTVDQSERYVCLQGAAGRAGVRDWKCPALAHMWAPFGVSNLRHLCAITTGVREENLEHPGAAVAQRFGEYGAEGAVADAWEQAARLPPEDRYGHMREVAVRIGADAWTCPDLEELWSPTSWPETPSGSP